MSMNDKESIMQLEELNLKHDPWRIKHDTWRIRMLTRWFSRQRSRCLRHWPALILRQECIPYDWRHLTPINVNNNNNNIAYL